MHSEILFIICSMNVSSCFIPKTSISHFFSICKSEMIFFQVNILFFDIIIRLYHFSHHFPSVKTFHTPLLFLFQICGLFFINCCCMHVCMCVPKYNLIILFFSLCSMIKLSLRSKTTFSVSVYLMFDNHTQFQCSQ